MDLVAGAVGSIISKLGELLQAEYKLQKGLRKEIESLKNELECAQMALLTVREVRPEQLDPQVRLWARKIREASYDMEDILDTFLVHVEEGPAPEEDGLRKRLQKKMAKLSKKSNARHTIAGAIEDMKKRLQEVSDRRDRYSIPVAVAAPATTRDPRLDHMYKEAAQIIGIERTRAELIAMLQSSSPHGHGDAGSSNKTKIVSVVGAGGLGKTTLAKAVYDELSPGYDCGAFVSVGRNPDLVQVLTSIFFLLDKEEYKAIRDLKDLQLLTGELRKFLGNKRYYIVIDDVWDIKSWRAIASALDQNNSGSKIIKTTRNRDVACSDEVYYKLDPLTHDNSKKLFYTRLFGGDGKCPANHPEEASEKILKKCGGVPLAIITMASLLVGKSSQDWLEVCNSPGFYGGRDNMQVDDTEWILSLSYYDLPCHLKTCLLYLSVFPEDSLINKDSLIWKWIAEGFVEKKPRRGLFEVGEEYFHELINRSLIQAVDSDLYGINDGCRVHDMVLDLIVSMSLEENFVCADGTSLSQSHARRVSLKNRELDLSRETDLNLPQVRSFIVWQCAIVKWAMHPRLNLIRVLALEGCTFREESHSLEHIGKLLHLRYLGIRYSWLKGLPEGIGTLKFLETLDLEIMADLILPCSIGMLTRLVCLRAHQILAPDGVIGRLTSLEELQIGGPHMNDESQRQFVKDLGNLCELRVLKINTNRRREMDEVAQTDFMHSLGSLQKMQHLTLGDEMDSVYMNAWDAEVLSRDLRCLFLPYIWFPKMPSWINSSQLPSLTHLEIHVKDVDEQGLKALGMLPELCFLKLHTNGTVTSNTKSDGCFQKLRSLVLQNSTFQFVANEDSSASFTICHTIRGMATGSSRKKDDYRVVAPAVVVMPKLEELEFSVRVKESMQNNVLSCEDLGLEYLPSLRKVKVLFLCHDTFEDDVEREEAALRHAVEVHPNRPALQIVGNNKFFMKRRSDDDASVQPQNEEGEEETRPSDDAGSTSGGSF